MSAENKQYKTVSGEAAGEIVEKKSRFIATVIHVESEEEAIEHINRLKKQYWDARHNCYSYILGKDSEIMRFSDDGEPSGTAGKPILEVLKGRELTNILVVVTRYFGGVLLGTGGLVRAYTDSTVAGLDKSDILRMTLMQRVSVSVDYNSVGKLKYVLSNDGIGILDEIYTDSVQIDIALPVDEVTSVENKLTDVTSGRAKFALGDISYYPEHITD